MAGSAAWIFTKPFRQELLEYCKALGEAEEIQTGCEGHCNHDHKGEFGELLCCDGFVVTTEGEVALDVPHSQK